MIHYQKLLQGKPIPHLILALEKPVCPQDEAFREADFDLNGARKIEYHIAEKLL